MSSSSDTSNTQNSVQPLTSSQFINPTPSSTTSRKLSKKGKEPHLQNGSSTTSSIHHLDSNTTGQVPNQDLSSNSSVQSPLQLPPDTSNQSDREKEKDKGSMSTSVSATLPRSQHRKNKMGSEGAHYSSTEKMALRSAKERPNKQKKSVLSTIFRRLFSCVSPHQQAQIIDVDDGASGASIPSSAAIEKQQLNEKEKEASSSKDHTAHNEMTAEKHEADPSTATLTVPPLTIIDITPPSPTDPAVVVPPSPTKHALPEADAASGLFSGAVQPPGSTGEDTLARDAGEESDRTSFTEDEVDRDLEEVEDEEEKLIRNGGAGIPIGPDGVPRPLLPPIAPQHVGRKCLVLDLDETLVHSSFKSIQHADYVVPVEIEYHYHNVYVIKRPGVDNFLKRMGELYEVVVFTASLSKYADPVLDKLDIHQVVSHRLFRESCYNHRGNYVKDLSQLGRPIADTIILDNSPASYIFHPNNAVPVSSWFNDPHDTELTDLCPFLADLGQADDVRGVLDGGMQ